jgi:hypothetical protein
MSMAITLTLGWWVLPLAVTIGAFAWASWGSRESGSGGGYGVDPTPVLVLGLVLIVSLVAWLIWAVLT